MDLSILIPSRNEMFLKRTIEDILEHMEGDTEIIVVCDGNWPDPPIEDDPRVHLIYHSEAIGQRAAVNEAARMSTAKYIMKADAHCAFDQGFDVKLMADCEPDWTVVPRMYNLHVFDWKCQACGNRTYQGPTPGECSNCSNTTDFEMVLVWKPKRSPETDFMRFDRELRFQYWSGYKKRPEAQGDLCDLMSCLGACWFMERQRFWELGGLDEGHGSWGQMGTEMACKAWLSGGRMVVNKKTWFAHMFRTQGGDFGFPYKIRGREQEKAREYSRDLWGNDRWPMAKRTLQWMIDKFAPVPDWEDGEVGVRSFVPDVELVVGPGKCTGEPKEESTMGELVSIPVAYSFAPYVSKAKGIVFYTDNRLNLKIAHAVQKRLRTIGLPIVSVSLKPMGHFGDNVHLEGLKPGYLTMFKQILAGLEASDADIIFFCEHDVLYHPSHFDFVPPRWDVFYYNESVWKVDSETGQALFYYCKQTSGLCAYRSILLQHYRKRVEIVEREGFTMRMGFEPGTHGREARVDDYKAEAWMSDYPNIDIRHGHNLTPSRWRREEFRSQRHTRGWMMADEVPGWGRTKGRFKEFLKEVG